MVGIGLMSGTSLDGVDAALVRIESPTHATLLDFVTRPYDDAERAELLSALSPGAIGGCDSGLPSSPNGGVSPCQWMMVGSALSLRSRA